MERKEQKKTTKMSIPNIVITKKFHSSNLDMDDKGKNKKLHKKYALSVIRKLFCAKTKLNKK